MFVATEKKTSVARSLIMQRGFRYIGRLMLI